MAKERSGAYDGADVYMWHEWRRAQASSSQIIEQQEDI
jgi:hypothetical protein